MNAIPGPKALSREWHALRRYDADRRERPVVFGASEAAACCGMSPYLTPLDIFCQKRGLTPDQPDNDAMRMGRRLEPIILDEFEDRAMVHLTREHPMYFHPTINYLAATPDALIVRDKSLEPEAGVDAKSTTYRRHDKEGLDPLKFGEEGTDAMPVDYVLQGQQQMAVLDLPYVVFPVLFDASTLRIYRVERNEELIQGIIRAEKEMYERVLNDDPPEPNWEAEQTRSLINAVFGLTKGKSIDATEEMLELWNANAKDKEKRDELDTLIKVRTNKILYAMEDAERAVFPMGSKELRKIAVRQTTVTDQDVRELESRVGQQKRAGYTFLKECKVS